MIGGIAGPTPATMPDLSGSPTQPGDLFAALFAALAPLDAALPDTVRPMAEDFVAQECEELPDVPVSAEELLALVAVVPVPVPAPVPILAATAEQVVAVPLQASKRGETAPIRELSVLAAVLGGRVHAGAAEHLLAAPPLQGLPLANGVPQLPAPPVHIAPPVEGAAAVTSQQLLPLPDDMTGPAMPLMRDASPPLARELAQNATGRDPVLPQIPALQTPAPATPITSGSPSPMPVTAQHLAGQIATALPRLRQSGGEAVLTLDPARLGRVTLSWNPGESGGSVLTVRAVEPATAALLNRLGEDITAMLRAEPAVATAAATAGAGAAPADFRLDIGRTERVFEPRHPELANMMAQREFAGDAGLSRNQHRAPQDNPDAHPQANHAAAVNPDDQTYGALPRPARVEGRARLA